MDRAKLNFIIDGPMFPYLMAFSQAGVYHRIYPAARAAGLGQIQSQRGTHLVGLDRHNYGEIHLYLAFTSLGLLCLHLILHWQIILGLYARLPPVLQTRTRLAWAVLVFTLLLLTFLLPHHP